MAVVSKIQESLDWLDLVTDFHVKFGLEYQGDPRELPHSIQGFREKFLCEELTEYVEAARAGDKAKMLDALIDLQYVLLGTVHLHGFGDIFDEAFRRVHDANMRKVKALSAADSTRASKWDVVKPDGWQAPTFEDLL